MSHRLLVIVVGNESPEWPISISILGGCSLKTNESGTFQTQCHECITGFFGDGKRFLGKTSG